MQSVRDGDMPGQRLFVRWLTALKKETVLYRQLAAVVTDCGAAARNGDVQRVSLLLSRMAELRLQAEAAATWSRRWSGSLGMVRGPERIDEARSARVLGAVATGQLGQVQAALRQAMEAASRANERELEATGEALDYGKQRVGQLRLARRTAQAYKSKVRRTPRFLDNLC